MAMTEGIGNKNGVGNKMNKLKEELNNFYLSPKTIKMTTSRGVRWAGNVV